MSKSKLKVLYECHQYTAKLYPCKKDWWGRPLPPEICCQTDRVGAKSPIFDLFARSASAVTPSEKVQLTLIESLLRAFQWAQDEHRKLPLSLEEWWPWWGLKNAVSKNCTKAAITPKRHEIGCHLLLITNRKSHRLSIDTYRPRLPWMTLNGVIALILRFSPNSIALLANYVTASGWR